MSSPDSKIKGGSSLAIKNSLILQFTSAVLDCCCVVRQYFYSTVDLLTLSIDDLPSYACLRTRLLACDLDRGDHMLVVWSRVAICVTIPVILVQIILLVHSDLNLPLRPVYTYYYRLRRRHRARHSHCQIYIVWIVTDCLLDRLGSKSIMFIKWSISIGTMLNFDGDCDGHSDGDGTCEQALSVWLA